MSYDDTTYGAVVMVIGQLERLEQRFRQKNPRDKGLTFKDAEKLLRRYGCTLFNHGGGSHFSIKTPNGKYPQTITKPHEGKFLKIYHIKIVVAVIDEVKEEQDS